MDERHDVIITVVTDVPCHLWCRLTATEPQIHKKPIKRRGVQFSTELRFCFVSYTDYEQREAGDTITHTWLIQDWSFCMTFWVYFWGYVGGIISPSTSPFFKHHNSRVFPPAITVGWDMPALNGAVSQNQAVITSARPATGNGVLQYVRLYASPYPNSHYFTVAVIRQVGIDLWNVRSVYQAYCVTQGYSTYVVNLPISAGDCIAVWGSWGGIRRHFHPTEGKASDYYYSDPLIPGQNVLFNFPGWYDALGLYADNFSVP